MGLDDRAGKVPTTPTSAMAARRFQWIIFLAVEEQLLTGSPFKAFFGIVFFLATCAATGCMNVAGGPWTGYEVMRITSPDGKLDAVLVEGSAEATTSVSSHIFVVAKRVEYSQKGDSFPTERAALSADATRDLRINWAKPNLLEVQYATARIFSFTNFGSVENFDGLRTSYEVRLTPLDSESSLIQPNTANRSQKNQ